MKVIRFIFAPFFWLRDIRISLDTIRRAHVAHAIVDIKCSNLSSGARKLLVAFISGDRKLEPGDLLGKMASRFESTKFED